MRRYPGPGLGGRTYDDWRLATPPEYEETRDPPRAPRATCPTCAVTRSGEGAFYLVQEGRCPTCAFWNKPAVPPRAEPLSFDEAMADTLRAPPSDRPSVTTFDSLFPDLGPGGIKRT